jgi:hypothetical protein
MSLQYPEEFAKKSTIKADPFIKRILGRMSSENKDSFTENQLIAIKLALSGQKWEKHPLDIRGTLSFWRWSYYYVFIAGKETRALSRRQEQVTRTAYAFFILGFFVFSTLLGLVILYLIKSALGINILPGESLGFWGWLKG